MDLDILQESNGQQSDSFLKELAYLFPLREFSKGDHVFKQGQVCNHLYYIKQGIVRIYFYSNKGRETTVWFSSKNSLITAIDSFYFHKPTRDNCEVLDNLVAYTITYTQLEGLLNDEKRAKLAFYILFEVTRKMANLMDSVRYLNAEERYLSLIKNYPNILQHASLGQIASYHGITQETLSRIRGKI